MTRCTCQVCTRHDTATNSPTLRSALCPQTRQALTQMSHMSHMFKPRQPAPGRSPKQSSPAVNTKRRVRSVLASLLAQNPAPRPGCCGSGSGSSTVGHMRSPPHMHIGWKGDRKGVRAKDESGEPLLPCPGNPSISKTPTGSPPVPPTGLTPKPWPLPAACWLAPPKPWGSPPLPNRVTATCNLSSVCRIRQNANWFSHTPNHTQLHTPHGCWTTALPHPRRPWVHAPAAHTPHTGSRQSSTQALQLSMQLLPQLLLQH